MPKVKRGKAERSRGSVPVPVSVSLADQILQGDAALRSTHREKKRRDEAQDEEEYVDEKLSRKILQQARIQQEELQGEYGLSPGVDKKNKKQPSVLLGQLHTHIKNINPLILTFLVQ